MHPRRRVILFVALLPVSTAAVVWLSRAPSNHRPWLPEQTVLPSARFDGSTVYLSGVRDFVYTGADTFTPHYVQRTLDLDRLTGVWFVLTPFARMWRGPAHSFVTFGFADSQYVAISVEARKEVGEQYDPLTGAFRAFELMYVIGTERDLIGQRAAFQDYPVYLYPVQASADKVRALFVAMLERANALRDHPEFYNTLTSNCTSNIVAHVNRIAPGLVPASWRTVLPGYIDEVGVSLGLIAPGLDVRTARERYRINEAARRFVADPGFSAAIRRP